MPLLDLVAPSHLGALAAGILFGLAVALVAVARRSADDTTSHLMRLLPMRDRRRHATESLAFVAGLLLALPLLTALTGQSLPVSHLGGHLPLAIAGLAIGIGSRLANGSLSHHALIGAPNGKVGSTQTLAIAFAMAVVTYAAVDQIKHLS